jgi:hypothetical protein
MSFLAAIVLFLQALQDKSSALPPEPEAAAQKETLKKVKELFKDEYAKKSPADQLALARKMIQGGVESGDDLVTKFVLLKEARDLAVAAADPEIAFRAAEFQRAEVTEISGKGKKLR